MSEVGGWSDSKADALLETHDYGTLDALLREYVDVRRNHGAVDWLVSRAEGGHVIVLYHCLRNMAKYTGSSGRLGDGEGSVRADTKQGGGGGGGGGGADGMLRVMGSSEFRQVFRLFVLLLLRVIQDSLSVCAVQGHALHTSVYTMLRDKAFGWLDAQFPMSRWPHLRSILDELQRNSPCANSVSSLPSPVWIVSTSPSMAASYFGIGSHIYFNNPSPKFIEACEKTIGPLNEERAKLTQGFFTLMHAISWTALTSIGMNAFIPPIKLNEEWIALPQAEDSPDSMAADSQDSPDSPAADSTNSPTSSPPTISSDSPAVSQSAVSQSPTPAVSQSPSPTTAATPAVSQSPALSRPPHQKKGKHHNCSSPS